jgi:hypothetical protein
MDGEGNPANNDIDDNINSLNDNGNQQMDDEGIDDGMGAVDNN